MTLPTFYYARGTSWNFNFFGIRIPPELPEMGNIKALDGKTVYWGQDDPFPLLLDNKLWNAKTVPYPASALFMGPSIVTGVNWVVGEILKTPRGTPFALGGYSQGAAVASCVYNECRTGRLRDRRADLRAVVNFGSPMREEGHTYPGSSGYSGACDVPNSTTGGHGLMPKIEDIPVINPFVRQFARLRNTESLVWEFTMPNEVVSGVGDTAKGKFLVNDFTLQGLALVPFLAIPFVAQADSYIKELGIAPTSVPQNSLKEALLVDALTGATRYMAGGGHILYPMYPPPDKNGVIPSSGDTCYQIAAKHLNSVGQQIYYDMNPTVPAPTSPPSFQWFSTLAGG